MKRKQSLNGRINVMHLVWSLHVGGMEKTLINVCNRLPRDQFAASLCVLESGGAMENCVDTDHVDLISVKRRYGNDPTVPFRLARLLRRRQVDILHTNMWAALLEGVVAAKLARVPTVIHEEHGTIHERHRRVIAQRVGWAMANQVVAVSDALADRMTEIVGYPRSQIQVIPNSVDIDQFRRLAVPKCELREECGLPSDGYLIGMLARLVPFKNHAGVLHALAKLHQAGIDAHLALAGRGPLHDELQRLAHALGIAANVHFLGETDQVGRLLNSLDVFVSNSACNEGLSLAILEAMACEVPVVATAVAEHPEVLDDGRAGMLIPPKDEEALVGALRHLAEHPDARASLGRVGRQRAEDHYSVDAMVESYRQLYMPLPAGPRTRCSQGARTRAAEIAHPYCRPTNNMFAIRHPQERTLNSTPPRQRVLAIVGDSQVGLATLRSLARNGLTVFAVCNSPQGQSAHSRYCAGAWMMDRSPGGPAPVDQIESLARELQVGSVLPISESLHAALIENRDRFEPEIHVFSPAAEAFEKATDKDYLHGLCQELGVPVAKGMTLDKLMAAGGDALQFPLVLRTRRQNVSGATAPWKAAYACDKKKLESLFESVSDFADNVIVQEYHPGVEDHVHILMHRGEPFMIGEYVGEQHAPLAGGVTVQRVSCLHESLQADAVKLLKAIGWEGIATAQFHYDTKTGQYIFLEINPRMCGGQPTVIMAGFDSPFLLWQSHFEPEKMQKVPYHLGLRTRILGGCANWMLGMIRGEELPPDQQRMSKLGTIGRFVWNSGPWTKDDSFAWSDPKPFIVDFRQMFVKRLMKSGSGDAIDLT